ncbi:MAG: hypothetical protein JWO06_1255 [Bacteroidota bacterium]|nr:hypothetical protein [Bacteroidota bacterium]
MRNLIALLVLILIGINSCKEGCKDVKALNYDRNAKTENGTCQYCDSTHVRSGATAAGFDFSNSQFLGQHVMDFVLSEDQFTKMGNGCKDANINRFGCNVSLLVINLTQYHVNFTYSVTFNANATGFLWQYVDSNAVTINPFDTLRVGVIDTICTDFSNGSINASLFNSNYF